MNLAPLEDKAPPSGFSPGCSQSFFLRSAFPFYPVVPEILEKSSQSRARSSFSLALPLSVSLLPLGEIQTHSKSLRPSRRNDKMKRARDGRGSATYFFPHST